MQHARVKLVFSYYYVHTIHMGTIRKTISLPEQIAKRLDREAKRRGTSVSAIVTELVQQQRPTRLPYAGLIDEDEQLSVDVELILARVGT
jgi:macrodomain Ter protein organizer (MatP/YcbG family)